VVLLLVFRFGSEFAGVRRALGNKPASRGPKILDFDLYGAISRFPQIVRRSWDDEES